MLWDHVPKKLLVTGKSGSGKTTFWLAKIQEEKPDYLFVFDPDLEYSAKTGGDYCCDWPSASWCLKSRRPVIFDCRELFPGNRPRGFDAFCRWTFSMCQVLPGRKILACDEVHKFVPRSPAYVPQSFQLILDEGRRWGLDLMLISRRPNLVNEAIRAELTEMVCFKHTDRRPLAWLGEDGFNPEEIKNLKSPGGHIDVVL